MKRKIGEISAYIVAGGKSRRFGSDKARYRFRGKELILHVYDIISRVFEKIILVSHSDMEDLLPGVERIEDIIPGLGPIGGIHTALVHSEKPALFAVACDMPFISPDFIRFMAGFTDDHYAVIPGEDDKLEPLHAFYTASCREDVERVIAEGSKRIVTIFERKDVKIIGPDLWDRYGENRRMFLNINSLGDLEELKKA